jgi:hypothetical protein
MMSDTIEHIVVVGGGSAGWLVAGVLAAEHPLRVTLVESPAVPAIGVGEGTWPSMRDTLHRIGVSETDFFRECDAAFKQGSRFERWVTGADDDVYFHPFVLPQGYGDANLAGAWQQTHRNIPFADLVSFQPHLCVHGRAPKQAATPEFAAVANYGYHLDAGKFGAFLREHCVNKLGVRHIVDHVESIRSKDNGDIAAQPNGWIWDIGLPARRGIGHVYSSAHSSDEDAERLLRAYIAESNGPADIPAPRKLTFEPGYRERFWHRNVVAIGLSAGFIEPLEASALALVELSSAWLADDMPVTRAQMDVVAARFNEAFTYRWERVIDFLKLHYVLSTRSDTRYWIEHREAASIPERLQELLHLWRARPPSRRDFSRIEEVFPSASWQYILYGMGFPVDSAPRASDRPDLADEAFREAARLTARMLPALPSNRELLDHIRRHGLPRI